MNEKQVIHDLALKFAEIKLVHKINNPSDDEPPLGDSDCNILALYCREACEFYEENGIARDWLG